MKWDPHSLKVLLSNPKTRACVAGKKFIRLLNVKGVNPNRTIWCGDRSKYSPHQGKREVERRRNQVEKENRARATIIKVPSSD
jgi:hypothetical protein